MQKRQLLTSFHISMIFAEIVTPQMKKIWKESLQYLQSKPSAMVSVWEQIVKFENLKKNNNNKNTFSLFLLFDDAFSISGWILFGWPESGADLLIRSVLECVAFWIVSKSYWGSNSRKIWNLSPSLVRQLSISFFISIAHILT